MFEVKIYVDRTSADENIRNPVRKSIVSSMSF